MFSRVVVHSFINEITGKDKKKLRRKSVKTITHLFLTYVLGVQKNRLVETVLLSTHNIFIGWGIRKLNLWHVLLTKGLNDSTLRLLLPKANVGHAHTAPIQNNQQ